MTAIFLTILIVAHILIFIFSILAFVFAYKKSHYSSKDIYLFLGCFTLCGLLGFFIANHFAFLTSDKSVTLAMGYTAMPITQMSVTILSYPIVELLKQKMELNYAPVLFGIVASAPLSFLLTSTLSFYYWQLLGV